MQPTHGIVTDTSIDYLKNGGFSSVSVDTSRLVNAGDFIDLALAHKLTQLWVMPGTELSNRLGDAGDTFVTDALPAYDLFPQELSPYLHGWKTIAHGDAVDLCLPEYIEQFRPLLGAKTSRDLYTTLYYIQHALGTPLKWTAGRTGVEIVKATNKTPERISFIRPCKSDLTPFYEHAASDLTWSRPLGAGEDAMGYMQVIDRNAMYLAPMSGLLVGAGECVHVNRPAFNKKRPGLWHITLSGLSQFNGVDLPHPTNGEPDSWQDTPMVQCCLECGYQVEVIEAYVFSEAHTTFTPFYERFRDARQALMMDTSSYKNDLARTIALDQVKRIYTRFTGLLGYHPADGEAQRWYYRPDWRNAVVSEAKHRMFLTIKSFCESNPHLVAVYVDGLYLVSRSEDVNLTGIELSQQLGKYKRDATYPLDDVKHLLTDQPYTLVAGLADLERLWEAKSNA